MRLRRRLVFGIGAVSIAPLLLLGLAATLIAQKSVKDRVQDMHYQTAVLLSRLVSTHMEAETEGLGLAMRTLRLDGLTDAQREGFQRMLFLQFDDVNIVHLIDHEGQDVVPPLYIDDVQGFQRHLEPHEQISPERFVVFRQQVAREIANLGEFSGTRIGDPYLPPDASFPVLPLVHASETVPPLQLAVELSLKGVAQRLYEVASRDLEHHVQGSKSLEVALLDASGQVVFRGTQGLVSPEPFQAFSAMEGGGALVRYETEEGVPVLAACAKVEGRDWLVVVAEPESVAEAAGWSIVTRSTYVGLVASLIAVAVGFIFARGVEAPVVALRDGALRVADGDLGHEVDRTGATELVELASAFNFMSNSLQQNRAELEAQRVEIESWNRELQTRVDSRTAELRAAQDELVESGKQVAVAELGAGLAHELNNPLGGILGIAQILRSKEGEGENATMLGMLESEARRCTEIVQTLIGFSRPDPVTGETALLDLDDVLAEVLSLVGPSFRDRGVAVIHTRAPEPLELEGDRGRLGRALTRLLTSLRAVAPEGGRIQILGDREEDQLRVFFVLDAQSGDLEGLSRDEWMAKGMSLWVARRILAEHGGRLVEPEPDAPGRFMLALPAARPATGEV